MSETSTSNNVLSMLTFCIYSFCINIILAIVFFVKRVFGEFITRPLEFVTNTKGVCNDMAKVYILVQPELLEKSNNLNKGRVTSIAKEEHLRSVHFMELLDLLSKVISKTILKILSILNFSSMPFGEKKFLIATINRKLEEQLLISITPYEDQCQSPVDHNRLLNMI